MIILEDNLNTKLECNTYVALGSFDGLHIGHMKLINKAIELSKLNSAKSMVFTFKNHPLSIINSVLVPKLLMDNETKLEILESLSLDIVSLCTFDENFMKMTPEEFILKIVECYNIKGIVVGFNYKFGYKNSGDIELLKKLGKENNFEVHIVQPVKHNGEVVSSSRIRKLILEGNVYEARAMLLFAFSITGIVEEGRKIGRTLGFPTANIKYTKEFCIPTDGVYYTVVEYKGIKYRGITNIGNNPTVGGLKVTMETHILEFNEDLYGKEIKVYFISKIRDEIKFESKKELSNQLEKDKAYAFDKKIEI